MPVAIKPEGKQQGCGQQQKEIHPVTSLTDTRFSDRLTIHLNEAE